MKRRGVAFFPSVKTLSANPYWPILASEIEKEGVLFEYDTPSAFDLAWLLKNRNRIKVLNLHFIQQFYKSSTVIRKLVKLILFAVYLLLARLLGYTTVFTLHNLEPTYPIQPAWLDYTGHWLASNWTTRVIVHCQEARKLLAERYGRRRNIYFVDHPNVIDYYQNSISREDARTKLGLPDDAIVFLFIGGVRPNKGIELLIQTFKQHDGGHLRLMIAGGVFPPETYVQSLKDMAAGDDRINFFLDFIPEDEMQVYLNASDIVVLPFARILTSGTANLAMSFGRPVIVPRLGCLPELVEPPKCGWVFEPHDVQSLESAMNAALASDFAGAGRRAFEKMAKYTPEKFARDTLRAYGDPFPHL